MTVPVPLTDIEAAAREAPPGPWGNSSHNVWTADSTLVATGWSQSRADAAYIAAADPPTVLALCEALRIAVDIASEAVGRLGKIGNIYTLVSCSDMNEGEAWGQVEVALRGAPPEGDIAFYVLAERLAAVRELVDLGEKP